MSVPDRETVAVQGATALTLAGAVAFAALFVMRGGLADDPGAVARMFAFAVLPVWVSAATLHHLGRTAMGASCALIVGFSLALLLPVGALLLGPAVTPAALVILAAALLAQWRVLARALGKRPFSMALAIAVFGAAFVLFTAPSRVFLPEAIATGLALSDNYYHIAISQMLGNYGAISVGGDGPALHSYHFLSHLIAAGLSNAATMHVSGVYLYWAALSLKLQLVWVVFAAGLLLVPPARANRFLQRLMYAGLVMLLVGGLESESFLLGAALYVATVPLLLSLATETESPPPWMAIMLVVVAVLLCAFAKLSAGILAGVALLAVLWRLRSNSGHALLLIAAVLLIVPPVYLLVLPKGLSFASAPIALRLEDYYAHYFTLPTALSYLLPVLVIALLELRPRAVAADGTVTIRWTRIVARTAWRDAGAATRMVALSFVACLAVLVVGSIGSNVSYFSLNLYLLALLLLPMALDRENLPLPPALGTGVIAVLFGWMLLVSPIPFASEAARFLGSVYRAASGQGGAYEGHVVAEVRQSLHETGTPFGTLRPRIEAIPWEMFLADLQKQARARPGKLAVHIAPDADDVWRRLDGGTAWWCMAPHLMIPAETGLVQIRSMAPRVIEQACAPRGLIWYGFGAEQDQHRSVDLSDAALCDLARPMAASAVYVLHSYHDLSRNRIATCGEP